jgi:hypothetical protein
MKFIAEGKELPSVIRADPDSQEAKPAPSKKETTPAPRS